MKTVFRFQTIAALASVTMMLMGCATDSRYQRIDVDDERLTGRVKHVLNAQPVYKYPDVEVQTFRGVVHLSGLVATEAQKEAAAEIARHVRGVSQLENDILIAPIERLTVRDEATGPDESTAARAQATNDVKLPAGGSSAGSTTTPESVRHNGSR